MTQSTGLYHLLNIWMALTVQRKMADKTIDISSRRCRILRFFDHFYGIVKKLVRHLVVQLISLSVDRIFNKCFIIKKKVRPVNADVKQLPVILNGTLKRTRQRTDNFFSKFIVCVCCRHKYSPFLLHFLSFSAMPFTAYRRKVSEIAWTAVRNILSHILCKKSSSLYLLHVKFL